MTKKVQELAEEFAKTQEIYERKYGGKDHSGYDTLMKYEVNDERFEAAEAGFIAGYKQCEADKAEMEMKVVFKNCPECKHEMISSYGIRSNELRKIISFLRSCIASGEQLSAVDIAWIDAAVAVKSHE